MAPPASASGMSTESMEREGRGGVGRERKGEGEERGGRGGVGRWEERSEQGRGEKVEGEQ